MQKIKSEKILVVHSDLYDSKLFLPLIKKLNLFFKVDLFCTSDCKKLYKNEDVSFVFETKTLDQIFTSKISPPDKKILINEKFFQLNCNQTFANHLAQYDYLKKMGFYISSKFNLINWTKAFFYYAEQIKKINLSKYKFIISMYPEKIVETLFYCYAKKNHIFNFHLMLDSIYDKKVYLASGPCADNLVFSLIQNRKITGLKEKPKKITWEYKTANELIGKSFFGLQPLYGITRVKKFFKNFKGHTFKVFRKAFYNLKANKNLPLTNFLFFPLHFVPEASLCAMTPQWADQIEVVRRLVMFAPGNMKIVLKEHPAMAGKRMISEIRELLRWENVWYLKSEYPNDKCFEKAKYIFSINGTIALEAMNMGLTVGLLGRPWFKSHPNANLLDSPEKIYLFKKETSKKNLKNFQNNHAKSLISYHGNLVSIFQEGLNGAQIDDHLIPLLKRLCIIKK